jgi:hypothetical protein
VGPRDIHNAEEQKNVILLLLRIDPHHSTCNLLLYQTRYTSSHYGAQIPKQQKIIYTAHFKQSLTYTKHEHLTHRNETKSKFIFLQEMFVL